MDGRVAKAVEILDKALKEAANAAVELQRLLPEHQGVPHYSIIEEAAHEVGVRLSCLIQQQRSGQIAADAGGSSGQAPCPHCQKACQVVVKTRTVKSIDGAVKFIESQAHCTRCERDFFPSTANTWV